MMIHQSLKHRLTNASMLIIAGLFTSQTTLANPDLVKIVHPQYVIKTDKATLAPQGLSPAQIKVAYGFNNIPLQGAGQTIAILTAYDAPTVEADLAVFNNEFGLPACTTSNGCFRKLFANSPNTPAPNVSWALMSNMMVQWVHAMAPQAKILLIEAGDHLYGNIMTGTYTAMSNGATIVAMAWGSDEIYNQAGYDFIFSNPATTYIAGIGDTGNGTLYPAVSPNVIAVGGTSLITDAQGNYISESAWNSTGGGLSKYARAPAHQVSFPIPNNPNGIRGVPDVSYHADPNNGYAVYSTYGYAGWVVLGGTGAGVAQWAAIIADIRSGSKKSLTNLNSALYAAVKQNDSIVFRDITSGANGSCGYYCNAQPGYDYVTGLGTPRVDYLAYEVLNLFKKKQQR